MRFALALPAVLLTPSLLFAQSDRVRGCVEETPQGVVLRASGAGRQAFESQSSVDAGQRFLLVGDDDLLEEIVLREGQEIQVTGRINPETSSPALVEPPIFRPPGGGTFPGAGRPPGPRGGNPFNPRVSVRQGDSRRAAAEDVIVVEDYRAVRPTCRDLERSTR